MRIINNYRVLGVLAQGGMGIVYRAEHITIGQKAVIKQLLPELTRQPEVVARFLSEAQTAAAIDDPGIVKIFDQGTLPDGSAYITMELLTGESLRDRLRREGALHPMLASAFLRQAARAVGAAHRRGIVHRDLKPENIFLCTDPDVSEGVRAKVLDFGIAKLLENPGSAFRTRTGMPLGTPAYMSPEQWRSAATVDARTDIYALGCILYEMLTGAVAFPGPELPHFMDQHRFAAPPVPSATRSDLVVFDAIVASCLAKDPGSRFASAEELMAALPRFTGPVDAAAPAGRRSAADLAQGGPVFARSSVPQPPHPRRIIPVLAVASGAAVAAAVVVILVTSRGGHEPGTAPAELPAQPPPAVIVAPPDSGASSAAAKLLGEAQDAMAAQKWMAALLASEKVLKIEPANAEAKKIQDQASAELRNQVKLDPAEASKVFPKLSEAELAALVASAKEAARNNDWKAARDKADDVLRSAPNEPDALAIGGIAACNLLDKERAKRYIARLKGQRQIMIKQICAGKGLLLE